MNTICSKQKFLAKIARERTRTDRTGDCFSVITFNLNTLNKHESDKHAVGDLLIKNTRDYDDIGFLEKNCFGILFHQISYKQAHKVADRFCRTVITENLNPTFTVLSYPSPEEFGKQEGAQPMAIETSKTIPHLTAWSNTYGSLRQQLKALVRMVTERKNEKDAEMVDAKACALEK